MLNVNIWDLSRILMLISGMYHVSDFDLKKFLSSAGFSLEHEHELGQGTTTGTRGVGKHPESNSDILFCVPFLVG